MSTSVLDGFLNGGRIQAGLGTRCIGRVLEVLPSTTSTNDAVTEGGQPLADGRVVFAEQQSAGRGRMGRSWASSRGASLLFSVLLREGEAGEGEAPAEPRVSRSIALPLLAAIACRDGIAAASDVLPLLHWPNDLYIGARKLGGILIETRLISGFGQAFIIGVGINCLQKPAHFTPELRARATSLEIESRAAVQREVVAAAVLNELEAWIGAPQRYSAVVLREAWLSRAAPLGQRVRLREDGVEYVGCIVDLDPAAGIVVQLERGGRRSFAAARTTIVERSFLSP